MSTDQAQAVDSWGDAATETAEGFDDFDAGDVDASQVGSRVTVDKPGKYHFEIVECKERPEKIDPATGKDRRPNILLTCVVLHTVEGQSPEGAIYYHELLLGGPGGAPQEPWSKRATCNFLHGVGVLVKHDDKIIDPETKSTRIALGSLATRLKSLQFVGQVKREASDDPKYADKFRISFGQGVWRLDDPAIATVPVNKSAKAVAPPYPAGPLPVAGEGDGFLDAKAGANGNGTAVGKSAPASQSAGAAAPAGDDDLLNDPSL